jgi:CRISPR-associated endonuclease/helicase Cas3
MRGTSAVYRNHAIVWRTARILMLENRFDLPEAAREIIEAVYGDEAHTPPDLQKSADEALGAAHADQSTSNQATLEVRGGYAPGPIWLQNAESQTRLGDPQTTLRLARIDGDRLRPWADDPDPWRAWKLSEVRVRAAALGSVELPQEWQSAAVAIRAEWPDRDAKHVFLCLLQESNGEYVARLLRDGNRPAIGYSPDIGLRL